MKRVLGHTFVEMDQCDRDGLDTDPGTLIANLDDVILLLTPEGKIVEVNPEAGTEVEWCPKSHRYGMAPGALK